jgi:hypothetical protein
MSERDRGALYIFRRPRVRLEPTMRRVDRSGFAFGHAVAPFVRRFWCRVRYCEGRIENDHEWITYLAKVKTGIEERGSGHVPERDPEHNYIGCF